MKIELNMPSCLNMLTLCILIDSSFWFYCHLLQIIGGALRVKTYNGPPQKCTLNELNILLSSNRSWYFCYFCMKICLVGAH